MRFKHFYKPLCESTGKTLIIVDIQPGYKHVIHFSIEKFVDFLIDSKYDNYLYLYNGPETVGIDTKQDILNWIYEELDYDEEKIDELPDFTFYDKGYAFFRNAIDDGYDKKDILKVAEYLIKTKKNDSRDITDEEWKELKVKPLRDDALWIPEVYDVLKEYNNIDICGGGKKECLYEVELLLDLRKKHYNEIEKFIY